MTPDVDNKKKKPQTFQFTGHTFVNQQEMRWQPFWVRWHRASVLTDISSRFLPSNLPLVTSSYDDALKPLYEKKREIHLAGVSYHNIRDEEVRHGRVVSRSEVLRCGNQEAILYSGSDKTG